MSCLYTFYMKIYFLVGGDILAILITTLIGFATHGETDTSFLPRMAAIFFFKRTLQPIQNNSGVLCWE